MKKVIIILSALAVVASGYGQVTNKQNSTVMDNKEKLDFELLEKFAKNIQ